MKNIKFAIVTLCALFVLVSFQNSFGQEIAQTKDEFENMSFEAEINKKDYVLLEPIAVRFVFSNRTKQPQRSFRPNFFTQAALRVSNETGSREINSLFNISVGTTRFSRIFMPGETIEAAGLLQSNYDKFFTQPGKYKIQFFLSSPDGLKKLASSVFEIEIKAPVGIDKEAFDYLKKYRNDESSNLFYLTEQKDEMSPIHLETFAAQYASSVYWSYAVFSLGHIYLSRGELEKAKSEFEKLKNSSNDVLADEVKASLAEIETNLKDKPPR